MHRRSLLSLSLAASLTLLGLSGCEHKPQGEQPFRILVPDGIVPIAPMSVIELADQLGYYRRAGVRVEFVRIQATPTAIAALKSGQGEMANVSLDAALQLVARDQIDLKAVVSPDKALPYVVIARDSIGSVADLKGKTFGIGRIGSVDYLQTRAVLGRLGVPVGELSYLAVGLPNVRTQALAAGRIDATTVTVGTWTAIKSKQGMRVLIDSKSFHAAAPFISKVSVVTQSVAKTRRREVAAIVQATMEASRDFAANPELWVNAMHKARPDVPRDQLEQLAQAYRDNWSVDGGLPASELEATTDALYQTPDFTRLRRVNPHDWVDHSFIDEAAKHLAARGVAK